jgi:NAD(P)-dependent dehydrogenase (short-subunit alcohol dehydrogenase family)
MGYASRAIAARLAPHGWRVVGTTRDGRDGTIAFADHDRVAFEARQATAILSSVPPDRDGDPVLRDYRDLLGRILLKLPKAVESRSYVVMEEIKETLYLAVDR